MRRRLLICGLSLVACRSRGSRWKIGEDPGPLLRGWLNVYQWAPVL